MGPEENILVNSPISTFQQGLTHSALFEKVEIPAILCDLIADRLPD